MIVAAGFGYGRGVTSSRSQIAGESPVKSWFTEEPRLLWINAIVADHREDRRVVKTGSIMNAGQIARAHFAAAMAAATAEGQDPDAVARTLLAEIVRSMLSRRSPGDVRAEILAAADNVDPETDYMFMRP